MMCSSCIEKDYYQCSSCSYKTTRASNANRHIKLKHEGRANAYNYKKQKFSIKNKLSLTDDLSELEIEDLRIKKILEKITEPFEILQETTKSLKELQRAEFINTVVLKSLESNNPAKTLTNANTSLKCDLLLQRLAEYMSLVNKKPIVFSLTILKEKIKLCPVYYQLD